MQDVPKIAAAVRDYKRSGKFRFREAKTAAERKLREDMHQYLREVMGR